MPWESGLAAFSGAEAQDPGWRHVLLERRRAPQDLRVGHLCRPVFDIARAEGRDQIGQPLRLAQLDPLELDAAAGVAEQPHAAPEGDRGEVEDDLVQEPAFEALSGQVAAEDADVLPSACCFTRTTASSMPVETKWTLSSPSPSSGGREVSTRTSPS